MKSFPQNTTLLELSSPIRSQDIGAFLEQPPGRLPADLRLKKTSQILFSVGRSAPDRAQKVSSLSLVLLGGILSIPLPNKPNPIIATKNTRISHPDYLAAAPTTPFARRRTSHLVIWDIDSKKSILFRGGRGGFLKQKFLIP